MASGIKFNDKNSHFEAKYEHPWGGVASDAAPMDIAPSQFIQADGVIIKNGVLNAACLDNVIGGFHPNVLLALIFNINDSIYFLDFSGNIYGPIAGNQNNLAPDTTVVIASNVDCINASCVQVINSIAYIFNRGGTIPGVYVFDPSIPSLVLGSDYVAGLYCCTVDQYLITANSVQPTDAPALKTGRVSWSGPDEYITWDPSIDRTAGYNVLTDVSDYISAVFAMGNIAYVLRSQGLTQMTPTGVGIAPFDFTSLWASDHGVGCTFPETFAQYGYIAIWMNDSDIFVFSGSGAPQGITGAAKDDIYSDIIADDQQSFGTNVVVFVGGCIHNNTITISSQTIYNAYTVTPNLEYSLFIVTLNYLGTAPYTTSYTIVNWIYSFKDKTWTRIVKTISITGYNASTYLTGKLVTSVYGKFLFTPVNSSFPLAVSRLVPLLFLKDSQTNPSYLLSRYQSDLKYSANTPTVPPAINLVFKQEEIRLTRQPQVRGVAIKAKGVGTLTITVSGQVQGVNSSATFTPIVLNSTTAITALSSGIYTGEDPQLSISSTSFDGVIIKASMFGTYADGEPF
jgi:hypothetical protein